MESEVEEDEDDQDAQQDQELQALLGPDLVLPLPRPGEVHSGCAQGTGKLRMSPRYSNE